MIKKLLRPVIILLISSSMALISAAITYTAQIYGLQGTTRAALLIQTTPPTQVDQDRSEIGSTDETVVMGGVIATIVVIPILFKYKDWKKVE